MALEAAAAVSAAALAPPGSNPHAAPSAEAGATWEESRVLVSRMGKKDLVCERQIHISYFIACSLSPIYRCLVYVLILIN